MEGAEAAYITSTGHLPGATAAKKQVEEGLQASGVHQDAVAEKVHLHAPSETEAPAQSSIRVP